MKRSKFFVGLVLVGVLAMTAIGCSREGPAVQEAPVPREETRFTTVNEDPEQAEAALEEARVEAEEAEAALEEARVEAEEAEAALDAARAEAAILERPPRTEPNLVWEPNHRRITFNDVGMPGSIDKESIQDLYDEETCGDEVLISFFAWMKSAGFSFEKVGVDRGSYDVYHAMPDTFLKGISELIVYAEVRNNPGPQHSRIRYGFYIERGNLNIPYDALNLIGEVAEEFLDEVNRFKKAYRSSNLTLNLRITDSQALLSSLSESGIIQPGMTYESILDQWNFSVVLDTEKSGYSSGGVHVRSSEITLFGFYGWSQELQQRLMSEISDFLVPGQELP